MTDCVRIRVHVFMCASVCLYLSANICVSACACVRSMYMGCSYVFTYISMHVCMYVNLRTYVLYACMMYVCK